MTKYSGVLDKEPKIPLPFMDPDDIDDLKNLQRENLRLRQKIILQQQEVMRYGHFIENMMSRVIGLDKELYTKYRAEWKEDLEEEKKSRAVSVILYDVLIEHVLIPVMRGDVPTLTRQIINDRLSPLEQSKIKDIVATELINKIPE